MHAAVRDLDGAAELARDQAGLRRTECGRTVSRPQDGTSQHIGRDQRGSRFGDPTTDEARTGSLSAIERCFSRLLAVVPLRRD